MPRARGATSSTRHLEAASFDVEVVGGQPVGGRTSSGRAQVVEGLEIRDTLSRRIHVLVLCLTDAATIAALFLQLTPPGLPLSMGALAARINMSMLNEFWFWPLVAVALVPLLCGGVLGVLLKLRWALWLYTAVALACVAVRLFLAFEMSAHEMSVERTTLLIDTIVLSLAVLIELQAADAAASLAMELRHNAAAHKLSSYAGSHGRVLSPRDVEPRRSRRQRRSHSAERVRDDTATAERL